MADYMDKIKELEDELKKTPYNKRTQHHIGLVKAKIATLKEREISRSSSTGSTSGYSVRKTGDGTVVLVGFPSVGKSSLLNTLTGANSEVGEYAFTTLDVIPGLLKYNHAQIQILDVPGIVNGAAMGRGRGKEVLSVMRSADMVLVIIDVNYPEHYDAIMKEIYDSGLRLNSRRPDVKITKKERGGISVGSTVKLQHITKETIKSIMKEFRYNNADIIIRNNITVDQMIDVIEDNKVYVPGLVALNKVDMVDKEYLEQVKKEINPDILISAKTGLNTEELKDLIFDKMNLIRVFCKEYGQKADMDVPLIIRRHSTIRNMCEKLHKDFVSKFRYARVWGPSAKYDGQKYQLNHKIKDKDIIEIRVT